MTTRTERLDTRVFSVPAVRVRIDSAVRAVLALRLAVAAWLADPLASSGVPGAALAMLVALVLFHSAAFCALPRNPVRWTLGAALAETVHGVHAVATALAAAAPVPGAGMTWVLALWAVHVGTARRVERVSSR